MAISRSADAASRGTRIPAAFLLLLAILLAQPVWSKPKPKRSAGEVSEDSLQTLVAQDPENPSHWVDLGRLAVKNNQLDLAKGYFDEAIKLSGRSGATILQVGGIWLSQGKVRASLPYLMPNLVHLDSAQLDLLQSGLEKEKLASVQLVVLRHFATRSQSFHPLNHKAAILAYRQGEFAVCHSILLRFAGQLDYESARNFLIVSFFLGADIDPKVLSALQKKYPQGEVGMLVALCHAQNGRWREARSHIARESKSAAYRDYFHLLQGMEAAADDRPEEAAEHYEKALESPWDRLRVVIYADLYRLYSTTGNKFKADQVWESLKEEFQEADPEIQEFMARQLLARTYEKQAKYFYRVVLRRRPGNLHALANLWDDLIDKEDDEAISENLKIALDRDPLSCDGNTLAMNWNYRQRNEKELLPYARNATIYCYETLEPYFILGSTLLNLSKPDEARAYFSTYIRKGGDANRVPLHLR